MWSRSDRLALVIGAEGSVSDHLAEPGGRGHEEDNGEDAHTGPVMSLGFSCPLRQCIVQLDLERFL